MKKGLVHTFRLHKEKLLKHRIEYLKDRANLIDIEHDKVFFNDFLIVPDRRKNSELVKEYCERRREERTQIFEQIDLIEKELFEVQRLLQVTETNQCSHCHCKTDFLGEIVWNLQGETLVNVCLECIEKIHEDLDKEKKN